VSGWRTLGFVSSWGSYSFLFGPTVAVVALVVLAFVMRWAFSSGASIVSKPARTGTPAEYGVLVPIAEPTDPQQAAAMQQILSHAGYAVTVAETTEGLRLLAWPAQAAAASALLDAKRGP
jgi:hypothetical protein